LNQNHRKKHPSLKASHKNHPWVITITKQNHLCIKYTVIVFLLVTTVTAALQIDPWNPLRFIGIQQSLFIIVAYVFLFICWQALNNNLSRITFIKRTKQRSYDIVFILIGYTFSFMFSVMVMIFLFVAHYSGTGVTRIVWDHFGEMTIETILFAIAFLFTIYGYYHMIHYMNRKKKNGGIYDQ